jgi:BlaI family transcriptional regulator, penicillinase repressor
MKFSSCKLIAVLLALAVTEASLKIYHMINRPFIFDSQLSRPPAPGLYAFGILPAGLRLRPAHLRQTALLRKLSLTLRFISSMLRSNPRFIMMKTKIQRPTKAETEILQVLWKLGPSTVRQVYDELGKETGYTTILKIMQNMAEKGLVTRDESERTHVYKPAQSAEKTRRHLIRDLIDRAFNGSAMELVVQALSSQKASPGDLQELRKILDQLEKGKK